MLRTSLSTETLRKSLRLTTKLAWSSPVVNTASGGQGQVIKLKKNFLNTLPLATNHSRRCSVKYTRLRDGMNTYTVINNELATVVSVIKREEKSRIEIGKDPAKAMHMRFEKWFPSEVYGRLPSIVKVPLMVARRLRTNMEKYTSKTQAFTTSRMHGEGSPEMPRGVTGPTGRAHYKLEMPPEVNGRFPTKMKKYLV